MRSAAFPLSRRRPSKATRRWTTARRNDGRPRLSAAPALASAASSAIAPALTPTPTVFTYPFLPRQMARKKEEEEAEGEKEEEEERGDGKEAWPRMEGGLGKEARLGIVCLPN